MYSGFFFFKFPNQFVLIPKSLKNHKNSPIQIKKIDRQIWQKLFYMYYFIVFWKVPLYLIFSWFSWSRICIKQANYLLFWFFLLWKTVFLILWLCGCLFLFIWTFQLFFCNETRMYEWVLISKLLQYFVSSGFFF